MSSSLVSDNYSSHAEEWRLWAIGLSCDCDFHTLPLRNTSLVSTCIIRKRNEFLMRLTPYLPHIFETLIAHFHDFACACQLRHMMHPLFLAGSAVPKKTKSCQFLQYTWPRRCWQTFPAFYKSNLQSSTNTAGVRQLWKTNVEWQPDDYIRSIARTVGAEERNILPFFLNAQRQRT